MSQGQRKVNKITRRLQRKMSKHKRARAVQEAKRELEALRRPVPKPKPPQDEPTDHTRDLMRTCLELAVPLWVQRFRDEGKSLRRLLGEAQACADLVAEKGDLLQFSGKEKSAKEDCKEAFNALAKGMAISSFMPGGVKAFGLHFESDPAWLAEKPAGGGE